MNRFGDAPVDATAPAPAEQPTVNRFGDTPNRFGDLPAASGGQPVEATGGLTINPNLYAETLARLQQQRAATQNPIVNAVSGAIQTAGNFAGGVLSSDILHKLSGIAAVESGSSVPTPVQLGQQVQQNVAAVTPYDPHTASGKVGQFGGTVATQVLPMFLGVPPAVAALAGGASAEGGVRQDVANRRAGIGTPGNVPEQISDTQENVTAFIHGAVQLVAEKFGLDKIANAATQNLMKQGMAAIAKEYIKTAGVNATQMGLSRVLSNAATRLVLDTNRAEKDKTPYTEGALEDATVGGAMGVAGHAIGHAIAASRRGPAPAPPVEQYDVNPAGVATEQQGQPAPQVPAANGPVEANRPYGLRDEVRPQANPLPVAELPSKGQGVDIGPSLPPILRGKPAVYRVQEGGESYARPIEFVSDQDKALYSLAQPRQGKVQAEARQYLQQFGYTEQDITAKSKQVMDTVAATALATPGREAVNVNPVATKGIETPVMPQGQPANPANPDAIPLERSQPQPSPYNATRVARPQAAPVTNTQQTERPQAYAFRRNDKGVAPATGQTGESVGSTGTNAPEVQPGVQAYGVEGDAKPVAPKQEQGKLFLPPEERAKRFLAATQSVKRQVPDFKWHPPQNAEQARAAEVFRARGTEVVYFSGSSDRGFVDPSHPGFVFVNRDNPSEGLREALGHEFIHDVARTRPDLFKAISDVIPAEQRAAFEEQYAGMFRRAGKGEVNPAYRQEEGVALAGGKATLDNQVWASALHQTPGLLSRVVEAFKTFARSFTAGGRAKNKLIDQMVNAFESTLNSPMQVARKGPVSEVSGSMAALPSPSTEVRDLAADYTKQHGVEYNPDTEYAKLDEGRSKQIADWYEQAKHEPHDPKVAASYASFKQETLDQLHYLEGKGYKLEAWRGEGQPYKNSQEMIADVRNNKHLYFFQGGDLPTDHPLEQRIPGRDGMTFNDAFRAVHDFFGHAKEGVGFGPRGEENAWRSHSQMYSPEARPAMTAETRGQNSWVNFGPHGEANRANPAETRYAEQKATLPPPEFTQVERADGRKFLPDYKPRNTERKNTLEEVQDNLTEEEYGSLNNRQVKNAIDVFQSVPSDAEFKATAEAGMAKKGWYEKATKVIDNLFGADSRRFANVLAADSPRQSVLKNLQESMRVWRVWEEAGRPSDPAEVKKLLQGTDVRSQGLFGGIEGNTVDMAGRIPNLVRALTGPEVQELSGYKVSSFAANLRGDLSRSTNDTWMAKFGGLDQKVFADNGGYLGYTAKVRRVAKAMGIEPAHVQETVWSFFKTLTEAVNAKTSGSQALRTLTHEDILKTPAFHEMLGDPYVQEQLGRIGFTDSDIRAAEEAAGISQPAEAGRIAPRPSKLLEGVANRAEQSAGREVDASEDPSLKFLPSADDAVEETKAALRSRGHLPQSVATLNQVRTGEIAEQARKAEFVSHRLEAAVKEGYGVNPLKLTSQQAVDMSDALKGKPVTLPAPVAKVIAEMRGHIDALTQDIRSSGTVDPVLSTILGGKLGEYVNRSYRIFDDPKWVKNIPAPVMANAINLIEGELRAAGHPDPTGRAPVYVEELLSDWKKGGADGLWSKGKLGAKNLAILKKRGDISPEIRALMGEYNNPFVNYAKSVAKMSTLVANNRFLERTKAAGSGQWLFADGNAKPGYTTEIAAPESTMMAPLNGMRTSPEIAEAFRAVGSSKEQAGWVKALATANMIAKGSKTVGSLMTQMRNANQMFFNLLSGHFQVSKYGGAWKAMWSDMMNKGDAGMEQYVQKLHSLGILGDGVQAGELMADIRDTGLDAVDAYTKDGIWPATKRAFKAPLNVLAKTYAASDALGKAYGFENELTRMKEMHPTWGTQQQEQAAAERIRNTYPTYSKLPPFIRNVVRRQPLIGPFVSFWWESFRTMGHSAAYAYEDLNSGTAAGRKAGAQRIAGMSAVVGGMYGLQALSKALLGMDDKQEEDFRKFQPDWSRGNVFMFTGRDGKGNIDHTDLSSMNPYSPIIDSAYALVGGEGSPQEHLAHAVSEFFGPLVGEQLFTKVALDVARNKKQDTGSRVYNPEDTLPGQWKDILAHMWTALEPGTLDRIRHRIIPGLQGKETTYGDKINPVKEIAAELTGVKSRSFNFSSGLRMQASQFNQAAGDVSNLFLREAHRPGTLDKGAVVDAYEQMDARRLEQWRDLYRKVQAAKRSGLTTGDVIKSLRAADVSDQTIKGLLSGVYQPYDLKSPAVKEAIVKHGKDFPLSDLLALYRKSAGKRLE